MKPQAYRAPSVLETIRLDLTVLERAHAAGDVGTAKRCVDAAELMFAGLRHVLAAGGTDTGPAVWNTPYIGRGPDINVPKANDLGDFYHEEVKTTTTPTPVEMPPAVAMVHWRTLVRRAYSWRTLAWLLWLTTACVATMMWKAVKR